MTISKGILKVDLFGNILYDLRNMKSITNEYMEAVCERAKQVGGMGGGLEYAIGLIAYNLNELELSEAQAEILIKKTKHLRLIIESEKEFMEFNKKVDDFYE